MKRLTTFRLAVWAALLGSVYFLLAAFIPTLLLIDITNGLFLGAGVAVTIVYYPLVWDSIRKNRFDRVSQLSLGIALLWASIFMARAWSSYYRYMGSPGELLNHPFVGFFVFVAFVASCLFVSAPGYPPEAVSGYRWGGKNARLLFMLAFSGGLLAALFHFLG